MVTVLLQFAEKNPGMTRVMVGDALVFENERLHGAHEPVLRPHRSRSCARACAQPPTAQGSMTPTVDARCAASVITAFVVGRLQRYARSGFKRKPTEHLDAALQRLTA